MQEYWRIYYEVYEDGKSVGRGVYPRSYRSKCYATHKARELWGDPVYEPLTGKTVTYDWVVSEINPWKNERGC